MDSDKEMRQFRKRLTELAEKSSRQTAVTLTQSRIFSAAASAYLQTYPRKLISSAQQVIAILPGTKTAVTVFLIWLPIKEISRR